MKVSLYQLTPIQAKVRREAKRFNVLNCGRRLGKSKLAVNLLAEPALEGYPVAYFTPTYKLLNEQFKDVANRLHDVIQTKSQTDKVITLKTGGVIEFWTLDDPNAGRSRRYKRAVIDEGSFARYLEEAWLQSIRPTLTDFRGDAWFMSSPKGRNYWHTLCEIAKQRKDWMYWQIPTSANPYIAKEEIEAARLELPDFVFKQEYLAEFANNELNPFGFEHIDNCLIETLSERKAVFFGIDVAMKHDWTVIIGLDEYGHMAYHERFQKPLQQTEDRIAEVVKDERAIIDSTGLGAQMAESLRNRCVGLEGMRYTPGYGDNSKYKLINGLITAIQKGFIKVLKGTTSDELYNFQYLYTANGSIKYEAPSGLHDDEVNSLALAVKCMEFGAMYRPIVIGNKIINP